MILAFYDAITATAAHFTRLPPRHEQIPVLIIDAE